MDIGKHKEKFKSRRTIPTKLKHEMGRLHIKLVLIAVFCFLYVGVTGNHIERSLDEKLQNSMQHQSRLMRNKRDSHIPNGEGM